MKVMVELTLPQDGELLAIISEKAGVKLVATGTALGEETTKAPRKAKKAADVAASATPVEALPAKDPLLDAPAPAPAAAAPVAMSESESAARAAEANKAIVRAYPTKGADDLPEGFHKAKAVLAEFGVARTTDLVHAQRLQYIARLEAMIAAKAASPAQAAAGL
jgi:hypothetical protein